MKQPTKNHSERGTAIVEFAITAAFFLMIIMAIVSAGHLFWTHNALVESTRRGALGLSCLVTFGLRHAAGEIHDGVLPSVASTNGYVLAFRIGAVLLVIGGALVLVLLERVNAEPRNPAAELSDSSRGDQARVDGEVRTGDVAGAITG
jgi:hypothetical protein